MAIVGATARRCRDRPRRRPGCIRCCSGHQDSEILILPPGLGRRDSCFACGLSADDGRKGRWNHIVGLPWIKQCPYGTFVILPPQVHVVKPPDCGRVTFVVEREEASLDNHLASADDVARQAPMRDSAVRAIWRIETGPGEAGDGEDVDIIKAGAISWLAG